MELYYLDQNKRRSRALYEHAFPDDSAAFIDYYYEWKCRDNQILVLEEDGEICSMLQVNPYLLSIEEADEPADYLVAVATKESCRHRGYMGRLLRQIMEEKYKSNRAFLYLMPAARAIYTPFGFEPVCSNRFPKYSPANWRKWFLEIVNEGYTVSVFQKEEGEKLARFANRILKGRYQLLAKRDSLYFERLQAEARCQQGDLLLFYKGEELSGYCYYTRESNEYLVVEQIWEDEKNASYQCLELADGYMETEIMIRILSLEKAASFLKGRRDGKVSFQVKDTCLDHYQGLFTLQVEGDKVSITQDPLWKWEDQEIATYTMNEICGQFFGQRQGELSTLIHPISKIWLPELV